MYGSCKSFCWVSSDVIDPSTCKSQVFWSRRPIENRIDLFFWKMVVLFLELLHWFLGKLLFNCSWFVFTLSNCVWITEVGSNFDQSLIVIVCSYNLVIATSTTRFNHSVDLMLFIFIPINNRWLYIASDLVCFLLLPFVDRQFCLKSSTKWLTLRWGGLRSNSSSKSIFIRK